LGTRQGPRPTAEVLRRTTFFAGAELLWELLTRALLVFLDPLGVIFLLGCLIGWEVVAPWSRMPAEAA